MVPDGEMRSLEEAAATSFDNGLEVEFLVPDRIIALLMSEAR